jgi:hypothetical protein
MTIEMCKKIGPYNWQHLRQNSYVGALGKHYALKVVKMEHQKHWIHWQTPH